MPRKRNKVNETFIRSALLNTWDYTQYEDMLTEIALSRFEWRGLPDSCDERYLERALLFNGKAVFCYDEILEALLSLKVITTGKFNCYGIPVDREAYGDNGYTKKCSPSDSVLVFNNYLAKPTFPTITTYAMRLYELDRTIEINAQAQKTPIMILCDENERLTMENLYTKYIGNQPVIFGKKSLGLDSLEVLKTDAPFVGDKIYNLKVNIFNEALTFLGISNVSIEKRERLINDEVSRSLGGTVANRMSYMSMRQKAVDELNKMFGLNVEVLFRGEDTDAQATATTDLTQTDTTDTKDTPDTTDKE